MASPAPEDTRRSRGKKDMKSLLDADLIASAFPNVSRAMRPTGAHVSTEKDSDTGRRGKDEDASRGEEELLRTSRMLLAGDRLGNLAKREGRSRLTIREREELEAARVQFSSADDHLAERAGRLSEQARGRGHEQQPQDFEDDHDRLSIKSEDSELGDDEIGQRGRHAADSVSDFVDLTKLSAASRRSAAPHIYNIYEQIFVSSDAANHQAHIPDLPDAVRASMRASGVNLEQELGLTGTRVEVVMRIDESFHNLTSGTGAANRLSKQLVADLAIALRIDKTRIEVTSVRSEGGQRTIAELIIMPGGDWEPAAVEVAEALSLQAGTPKSMLHAMTSTSRVGDVRFREILPAVIKGLQGDRSGPYQALLRGGLVVDDRGVRPTLSAMHGVTSADIKQKDSTSLTSESMQAQMSKSRAMQMVEVARLHQEGFWVDVESGIHQPAQSSMPTSRAATAAYGTFHAPNQKKAAWLWPAVILGGTFLLALVLFVLYLIFFTSPQNSPLPTWPKPAWPTTPPPLPPASPAATATTEGDVTLPPPASPQSVTSPPAPAADGAAPGRDGDSFHQNAAREAVEKAAKATKSTSDFYKGLGIAGKFLGFASQHPYAVASGAGAVAGGQQGS